MYKTLEDVEMNYPFGSICNITGITRHVYCASDVILQKLKDYYGEDNVIMVSPHHALCNNDAKAVVAGYIYDGEYWYPAESINNEWKIIEEKF